MPPFHILCIERTDRWRATSAVPVTVSPCEAPLSGSAAVAAPPAVLRPSLSRASTSRRFIGAAPDARRTGLTIGDDGHRAGAARAPAPVFTARVSSRERKTTRWE